MFSSNYTLYISNFSPYSYKASALLGWAGVDAKVKPITLVSRQRVLKRLTGKTMVPVLRKGGWAINDSTRIAQWALDRSERPLLPLSPARAALCWLLEEFADEWVPRWFIYERWHDRQNRHVLSRRIGGELTRDMPVLGRKVGEVASSAIAKRVSGAGAGPQNKDALARTRDSTLAILESLLGQEGGAGFLFGATPTVADFAMYGPLEQYRRDPVGAKSMGQFPALCSWLTTIDLMRLPRRVIPAIEQAPERDLSELAGVVSEFVDTYWKVLVANYEVTSRSEGARRVETILGNGVRFEFKPSRYADKRLEFVLQMLDQCYLHDPDMFPVVFAHAHQAIAEGISVLRRNQVGRALLTSYPNLPGAS